MSDICSAAGATDTCCNLDQEVCAGSTGCSPGWHCLPAVDDCASITDQQICRNLNHCHWVNNTSNGSAIGAGVCMVANVALHPCWQFSSHQGLPSRSICTDQVMLVSTETMQQYSQCKAVPSCDSTCTRCQQCVLRTGYFVAGQLGVNKASVVASAFKQHCIQQLYDTELCEAVAQDIRNSVNGNLGKRAGALCSRLQRCSHNGLNTCQLSVRMAGQLTIRKGMLDQCTVEGILGGTPTDAGPPALAGQSCFQDDDCPQRSVCEFDASNNGSYSHCYCSGGEDKCIRRGRCVAVCQSAQVQQMISQANKRVSRCLCSE